jgi:hypothetical protein
MVSEMETTAGTTDQASTTSIVLAETSASGIASASVTSILFAIFALSVEN